MTFDEQVNYISRKYHISQVDASDILKAITELMDEGYSYQQALEYISNEVKK